MHIVDAHHHLWDLGAVSYPWLMARGVRRFFGDPTPIQRDYLVRDFRADAGNYTIDASVHIQVGVAPGDEVRETAWLQDTAVREGLPSAIVAFVDLAQRDAMNVVEQHLAHTRVRGVRQIIGRSDEEDAVTGSGKLIDDPLWREHLHAVGELGLSFDLQLTPSQVPAVADLLATLPHVPVALCHCGSPWDQTPAGLASWQHGLKLLAELPQVSVKISGLGMFDHDWTVESIRPIVESCIDAFGPERTMFGSNFPVDRLHADFATVWGAYETITASLPEADRQRLFGDTARDFYRID
jgi:predicted TIM-barrel fold metal-dependent hydrolase